MANTNKTLKNKDQIDIYPITRERNVYDENNINLKEKFKSVVFNDNDIHKFAERLYEESANEFDANLLNSYGLSNMDLVERLCEMYGGYGKCMIEEQGM